MERAEKMAVAGRKSLPLAMEAAKLKVRASTEIKLAEGAMQVQARTLGQKQKEDKERAAKHESRVRLAETTMPVIERSIATEFGGEIPDELRPVLEDAAKALGDRSGPSVGQVTQAIDQAVSALRKRMEPEKAELSPEERGTRDAEQEIAERRRLREAGEPLTRSGGRGGASDVTESQANTALREVRDALDGGQSLAEMSPEALSRAAMSPLASPGEKRQIENTLGVLSMGEEEGFDAEAARFEKELGRPLTAAEKRQIRERLGAR